MKTKKEYVDAPSGKKVPTLDFGKSSFGDDDTNDKPLYVNGEPIITSGDASKYLVDINDEEPSFTLRSVTLGTAIGVVL
jgi:hypothetical protein